MSGCAMLVIPDKETALHGYYVSMGNFGAVHVKRALAKSYQV